MDTDDVRAFLAVADTGSVQAAAEFLQLPRTTLRRRIDALEARIGAPLLARGTQGSGLTDAGLRLAQRGPRLLEEASALLAELRGGSAGLRGSLTVAVPVGLPPPLLAAVARGARREHPGLSLVGRTFDDPLNALVDEVDLVFHFGDRVRNGPWITRRLMTVPERLMASEGYLAKHGTPATLHDLHTHEVFAWSRPRTDPTLLPLQTGDFHSFCPGLVTADVHLLRTLAHGQAGIVFVPDPMMPDPGGQLNLVLPNIVGRDCAVRLVVPEGLLDAPRIRAVLDALAPLLSDEPG